MTYSPETQKIDKKATDGLAGANNSLAYRIHELEKHFHNNEHWFGEHLSRNAEADCGQTTTVQPFVSTAGNGTLDAGSGEAYTEAYGTPLCVIGTNDTPVVPGMTEFDMHKISLVDVSNAGSKVIHRIQFIWGVGTVAAAIIAGQVTEIVYAPEKDGKVPPVEIKMPRLSVGTKVWIRHWVFDENAPTIDFFIGLHEYPG